MNKVLLFTILSGLSLSCTNYTDNISMTAEHPVLPVLTMKEANPVFKIELIRHQTDNNYSLQKLEVDLHGTTDIDDIESIGLYHTDSKGMIDINKPILHTVSTSEKIIFNTDISIDTDTFPFWISFKLKDKVDLSHRFKAGCTKIETNEGEIKVPVQFHPVSCRSSRTSAQARWCSHISYPRVSNIYKRDIVSHL